MLHIHVHFTFPKVVTSQENSHTPGHSPRQWNTVNVTGREDN